MWLRVGFASESGSWPPPLLTAYTSVGCALTARLPVRTRTAVLLCSPSLPFPPEPPLPAMSAGLLLQPSQVPLVGELVVARMAPPDGQRFACEPFAIGEVVAVKIPTFSTFKRTLSAVSVASRCLSVAAAAAAAPAPIAAAAALSNAATVMLDDSDSEENLPLSALAARLKNSPQCLVSVRWYDLEDKHVKRLRLTSDEHWGAQFAAHAATDAAADAEDSEGAAQPSRTWIVDQFKDTTFFPKLGNDVDQLPAATLIMWGSRQRILHVNGELTADAFALIRKDLTGKALPSAANGAKGAKSANKRKRASGPVKLIRPCRRDSDDSDDVDTSGSQDSPAAAAVATASQEKSKPRRAFVSGAAESAAAAGRARVDARSPAVGRHLPRNLDLGKSTAAIGAAAAAAGPPVPQLLSTIPGSMQPPAARDGCSSCQLLHSLLARHAAELRSVEGQLSNAAARATQMISLI